jgi:hypothetical protein
MGKRIVVDTGRLDDVKHYTDYEDGFRKYTVTWSYRVGFRTHGIDYMLRHAFPDTEAGKAQAERIAAKVQAVLDTKGVDGLQEDCWATRVIYGSQAYIDEEPYIVEREKADALLGV